MALPFLAEADIRQQFECLEQTANTATLLEFMNYVSSTWIEGHTWPPSCWSDYMQSVRTNNDVEGWHHGLHSQAQGKSHLPIYLLIDLLKKKPGYFIERPNGIRKKAPTSSAPPVPSNPSDSVLTVGTIRKWRQYAKTASQGLFFDCWAKRRVNFH